MEESGVAGNGVIYLVEGLKLEIELYIRWRLVMELIIWLRVVKLEIELYTRWRVVKLEI